MGTEIRVVVSSLIVEQLQARLAAAEEFIRLMDMHYRYHEFLDGQLDSKGRTRSEYEADEADRLLKIERDV